MQVNSRYQNYKGKQAIDLGCLPLLLARYVKIYVQIYDKKNYKWAEFFRAKHHKPVKVLESYDPDRKY